MSRNYTTCLLCGTKDASHASVLHRFRLLIDAGAHRRPRVVPIVVTATSAAAGERIARLQGQKFYGARFLGVVNPSGPSIRLEPV